MHYIRFLKLPRVLQGSPQRLSAKITVTTDLGEYFLLADVSLLVELEDANGRRIGKAKEYLWKGMSGMRSLEISILTSIKNERLISPNLKVLVRPKVAKHVVDTAEAVLGERNRPSLGDFGGVMAVRSMAINLGQSLNSQSKGGIGMAERVFSTKGKEIHIWEETGESIARHIWDAGLVLSCCLTTFSPSLNSTSSSLPNQIHLPKLPLLGELLSKPNLKILELGAGCGIVGITLSTYFPTAQVILTDLPEASEILTQNLSVLGLPSTSKSPSTTSKITHQILDWSQHLPLPISTQDFDLIVVADCTYNPDVVPDLVATLMALSERSKDVLILIAMKVRHESELVFFDLMREKGFVIRENEGVVVPVLEGEDERIEIFEFGFVG